ncbi:MAG TPA: MBL fold metallo-hydrolase [Ktedonosporobacter sp.]|nr:MBL fold metallo-hydrolase [Ktedonosporobacter sp.]
MTTAATALRLKVFTGSAKALQSTSTLISGAREAILIDAQFVLSDAKKLAKMVQDSGKQLTMIYITHAHPDHFFGLPVLQAQFPQARIITAPEVLAHMQKMVMDKLAQWKPILGDDLTDKPLLPTAYDRDLIQLEGEMLRIVHFDQGDMADTTVVYIPSMKVIIAGDLVHNGTHVWLAETDALARQNWLHNLDILEGLAPQTIVAGHKKADNPDDARAVLEGTREYIRDFDLAVKESTSAGQVIAKMNQKYADRELPTVLQLSAHAAFRGRH